jgi:TolA-binding protein
LSCAAAVWTAASVAGGCVLDRTTRSGTYELHARMAQTQERTREIQHDLNTERKRVDEIEERAATARQRLAESGATLETLLEELTRVRGDVVEIRRRLDEGGRVQEDVDWRLTAIEVRLAHLEKELKITPPELPPPPGFAPPPVEGGVAAGAPQGQEAAEPAGVPAPDEGGGTAAEESTPPAAAAPAPSREDSLFQDALRLVQEKSWDKAGGRLQKFLKEFPQSRWALEAQFLVGQCLFELGRWKSSIGEWQKVVDAESKPSGGRASNAEWTPKAIFMQGLAFLELGTKDDIDAARLFFEEVVAEYPKSPEAERARRKLEQMDGD